MIIIVEVAFYIYLLGIVLTILKATAEIQRESVMVDKTFIPYWRLVREILKSPSPYMLYSWYSFITMLREEK